MGWDRSRTVYTKRYRHRNLACEHIRLLSYLHLFFNRGQLRSRDCLISVLLMQNKYKLMCFVIPAFISINYEKHINVMLN